MDQFPQHEQRQGSGWPQFPFQRRFLCSLHKEVHLGREHVHLIEGIDTSHLGLEVLLIPSLVDDHPFNEDLGILDIFLQECPSS